MGLYLGDIPMSPFGKSAYQQAVAGGYKGTEDEFNRLLASFPEHLAGKAPSVHASQHAAGGSDPVAIATNQVTGLDTKLSEIDASLSKKVSSTPKYLVGTTIYDYIKSQHNKEIDAGYIHALSNPDLPNSEQNWGYNVSWHRGENYVAFAYRSYPNLHKGGFFRFADDDGWVGEWVPIATATPPQEYDLPLAEGVTGTAKYSKAQDSNVQVVLSSIKMSEPGTEVILGGLPEGYHPKTMLYFSAVVSDDADAVGNCFVRVLQNGTIMTAGYRVNGGRYVTALISFIAG